MHPPDRYTGHRLSDLLALGRDDVEITCPACGGGVRRIPIRELIARYGNAVLPAVLSLVTPSCPRRGRPDQIGCGAIYARPLTIEEEERIKSWRVG